MSSEIRFERDLIGDTSKHDRGTSLWLASAASGAACSRFALVCGALAVVLAVATGTGAILWAIPALLIVLFGVKLLDGRARQAAMRRARALPIRLPEPTEFSDDAVKNVILRLTYARQVIGHVLDTGPHGPGFDLTSAVAPVCQLERDAVVLSQRAEYVARFLADHPVSDLAAEDRRHTEKLEREQDESRAALLRRIGVHLKERLASTTSLQREYERLLASAKDAVASLESLAPRMMLLQLRRLEACHLPSALADGAPADLKESLREVESALADDRAAAAAE
jgi:hypothetical protein